MCRIAYIHANRCSWSHRVRVVHLDHGFIAVAIDAWICAVGQDHLEVRAGKCRQAKLRVERVRPGAVEVRVLDYRHTVSAGTVEFHRLVVESMQVVWAETGYAVDARARHG